MNQYITSDTLLVAALLSCGLKYTETRKFRPSKVEFVFVDTPELQNAVTGHYMGALTVPSITFGNNYKHLISVITSLKDAGTISATSTSDSKKA